MKIVVVIPTYNEAENLRELVHRIMKLKVGDLHVLFVDDNSPDGTADLVEQLSYEYRGRVSVLRRPMKLGLGTAYVEGFNMALNMAAERVIEMDADLSHSPEDIVGLIAKSLDADVVVGSRWVPGGGSGPGWGLGRQLLSRAASFYCRLVLALHVHDVTTGFKCFQRRVLEDLNLNHVKSQGFAFQVEVAYACQLRGYRIAEHPITFSPRASGRSKMSVQIVLEALWRVLAIRLAGSKA